MLLETIDYGATTFMFYTGAPQNSIRKDISLFNMEEAHELMAKHNINQIMLLSMLLILLMLLTLLIVKLELVLDSRNEIDRTFKLGMKTLVLHPGAHVGMGMKRALKPLLIVLMRFLTWMRLMLK